MQHYAMLCYVSTMWIPLKGPPERMDREVFANFLSLSNRIQTHRSSVENQQVLSDKWVGPTSCCCHVKAHCSRIIQKIIQILWADENLSQEQLQLDTFVKVWNSSASEQIPQTLMFGRWQKVMVQARKGVVQCFCSGKTWFEREGISASDYSVWKAYWHREENLFTSCSEATSGED